MSWRPTSEQLRDFRNIVDPDARRRYYRAGWWTDGTFADRVTELAQATPSSPAYLTVDSEMSWEELERASDRVAGALVGAGMEPGDRLGVLLPDGPTIHAVFLGAEKAGITVVGVGVRSGEQEIGHLLWRSGASVLLTEPLHRDRPSSELFEAVRGQASTLRSHVTVPRLELDGDAPLEVDGRICHHAPLGRSERAGRQIGPDDLFLVNSTSGTTGLPKCVTHTQNRWRYFHSCASANGALTSDDVIYSICPMPFGFGLWTSHVTPILLGCPTVLSRRFSVEEALKLIERERVTVLCCVSTQFIMMLESQDLHRFDLSSLRVMFTGGETVPHERARQWEEHTGSLVLQFYGSNETGLLSGTTVHDPEHIRLRTAGRVVADMEVRLFDGDSDVSASGRGQAACRGPATTPGYLDDPEANRSLFTPDGWMRMADLCTIEDGVLSVVGRTSDIIIRGGKNISAAQVEAAAMAHPSVALAAAVPDADPIFGERVCLYVQLRPAATLTLEELISDLRARGCGPDLLPERLVIVEELPLAAGGKVAKGQLKDDLRNRRQGASSAS